MFSNVARVVVAAGAVAGVVWAISASASARDCDGARKAIVRAVLTEQPDRTAVEKAWDRCTDPETIAEVAAGLARTDSRAAERFADRAVEEAPDMFASWAAVALTRGSDRGAAHDAWVRAKALNPRWSAPDPSLRR